MPNTLPSEEIMPCNCCNSMQSMEEMPGWIEEILIKPEENPNKKWTGEERGEKAFTFIYLNRIATPLGSMLIGTTDEALCLLEFTDRTMLEAQLNQLQKYYKGTFLSGSNKIIELTASEITEYFEGKRQDRKSTRLNSSHVAISYAAFCLKKKKRVIAVGNASETKDRSQGTLNR